MQSRKRNQYDLIVTFVPLLILVLFVSLILILPEQTGKVIENIRYFLGDTLGSYYLVFGLAFVVISLYIAFSKYGKIKLGNLEKPRFNNLTWGFMIFTSTMAADVLFYSLHEWTFYWNSVPLDFHEMTQVEKITWSETYSLSHWGIIPWLFYILPAVAYAYMIHVKKRNRQKISEACRPVLGKYVDRWPGRVIDIISVLALLFATSTTFSVATPLLSTALAKVLNIDETIILTILVLLAILAIYMIAVLIGFKGISVISTLCVIFFLVLTGIFMFNSNARFILDSAVNSIGNLFQNFIRLSSWTDPSRASRVPQDYTVYYWAYWIAWSIANPFFIAKISEGRTIKNLILGGTLSGVACTFLSFTVFGGFGIAEQVSGRIQIAEMISNGESASSVILKIFDQLPFPKISLVILVLAMIGFYASTFDALTHVIAAYSYKNISPDEEPSKLSKIYWAVLFVVLPCALLFSERTTYQLQGLSIIAAFPISLLMIIVIIGFFKEVKSSIVVVNTSPTIERIIDIKQENLYKEKTIIYPNSFKFTDTINF